MTNQHTDKATEAHFNTVGHSLSGLKIILLEQVKKKEIDYRKQREKYFIRKLNTLNIRKKSVPKSCNVAINENYH